MLAGPALAQSVGEKTCVNSTLGISPTAADFVTARSRSNWRPRDSAHSKLDKLKGESGKDFSSDFDSMQVSEHKDAVSLFERYAKGGENPDLKSWAGKTLPALKHHLEMAPDLSKSK